MAPYWWLSVLFVFNLIIDNIRTESADKTVTAARIESCSGCQLNRLPEVKKFIYEDVPVFENVEFKHIQGAPPELVLLDKDDQEVKRISLSSLSRQDCNELLVKNGFKKRSDNNKHRDDF